MRNAMSSAMLLVGPVAGALWLDAVAPARSQEYPAKPVRIIVPLAPGGLADQLARVVAQKTTATVIVDNRTGAGGMIGAEIVARWRGPSEKGFRVKTADGQAFDLTYRELPDEWVVQPI